MLDQQKIDQLLTKYGGTREELLLIGIRNESNPQADQFNDQIGYATLNKIELFPGTTDPGLYWTYHKINPPHGAAHYVNGFHKDLFAEGMHFSQVALVQISAAQIWRDDNQNFKKDPTDPSQFGLFAMNLHHANNSDKIYDWSAGCQVVQKPDDHLRIMTAVRNTAKYKTHARAAKFPYLLVTMEETI